MSRCVRIAAFVALALALAAVDLRAETIRPVVARRPPRTSKVCQVTGGEDRQRPAKLTGTQISGVTGGVTGTDLGNPVEHAGRLYFLFGDSREFPPDLCEPAWCGSEERPIPTDPPSDRVQRWRTKAEWDAFLAARGDGRESVGTAPLEFDPDECVRVTVETSAVGLVFGHEVGDRDVGAPFQFRAPKVASNPEDGRVLVVGNRVLVITRKGAVFAHERSGRTLAAASRLGGPPVAANPQDKWVLAMGERILVVTTDGRVFAHDVTRNAVAPAIQLSGPKVAANRQDKWLLAAERRLLVITKDGRVFVHDVAGDSVGTPFQLGGPKVAANPRDKWVLVAGRRIVVVTDDGSVFAHELAGNTIRDAKGLGGARVAANPRDRLVLAMGNELLVLTKQDGTFRGTKLDGRFLGRQEGNFGGFSDGRSLYAFFTLRNKPPGCTMDEGCAHDNAEPGGKLVLGKAVDGGSDFRELKLVSTTKFLWASADVAPTARVPDLPADMGERTLFVFGSGRKNNDRGANVAPWNHSYPFLAVAPLGSMGSKDGRVFAHDVAGGTVRAPFPLSGPSVAALPEDKWTLTMGGRILVITNEGGVFAHGLAGNAVADPVALRGPKVAANPQDRHVLVVGNRILVITTDGSVFAHDVAGDTIAPAIRLSGPKVAARPEDKWVVAAGNRILVVTADGRVFAHEVTADSVRPAVPLDGPKVAANPQDRRVLVKGDELVVVTADGSAFAHRLTGSSVAPATPLLGAKIGARAEDRWVLAVGDRLLVVTRQPWRYFAGRGPEGRPIWKDEERLAEPLAPFGSPAYGGGFHECFGYYSARFVEPLGRWVMLYACGDDAKDGYNKDNGPRGVYLRMASAPWGPWSNPERIFDPGDGYCRFMHLRDDAFCRGKGPNVFEESVRHIPPGWMEIAEADKPATERGNAGEYAPLLLPSRYAKVRGGRATLYFLMSTWNPYQIVLMKTDVGIR